MEGVRQLHHLDPRMFPTPVLAERFRISPEAVRRILKSKWEPTKEQKAKFAEREKERRMDFIRKSRMEEAERVGELEEMKREEREEKTERWESKPLRRKTEDHLTFT